MTYSRSQWTFPKYLNDVHKVEWEEDGLHDQVDPSSVKRPAGLSDQLGLALEDLRKQESNWHRYEV
jgi:hypothetical protein